jgi:hypothetical protein
MLQFVSSFVSVILCALNISAPEYLEATWAGLEVSSWNGMAQAIRRACLAFVSKVFLNALFLAG